MHEVVEGLLREALGFPGAWEDHPWGDTVVKVGKKVFVFLGEHGFSVKLPESAEVALGLPGAAPTGYGLGRAGWVSLDVTAADGDEVPVDLYSDFLDESYRAVAPKKLVKELDAAHGVEQ
ncbi:MAG TPA: MmcQ/YjbR family DNA-binding protein [Acidimicrobiales bacterium]